MAFQSLYAVEQFEIGVSEGGDDVRFVGENRRVSVGFQEGQERTLPFDGLLDGLVGMGEEVFELGVLQF